MANNKTSPDLSLKLFTVLYRAIKAVQSHVAAQIQTANLIPTDFAILEVLLNKGNLPIGTVGSKILLTNGSMTTAIDRLEKRGLVERMASRPNRRTTIIALTPEGRAFIQPIFAEHAQVIDKACAGLTATEQIQFIELAKKLGKYAESI